MNIISSPFLTATGMQLALERSEVSKGFVDAPETIAYVVIESGKTGTFTDNTGNTISYETIRSDDLIQGWDNGVYAVNFAGAYTAPPNVICVKNSHNGGDGGWLRRDSVSSTLVKLTVDEDRARDSERYHTTEVAGLFIFSQDFDADFL